MEKKIIFVDDEQDLLELYREMFEDEEYTVYTESDPIKALDTIFNKRIQVMFFDLKMPGMNGIELCQKIRAKNKIAIIYAITGYSSLFELSEIREVGFDDYFKKPPKLDLILTATEQAFEKLERWSYN